LLFFYKIILLKYITFDRFLLFIVFISVSSSISLQFIYNLTPCKLCLYQRYLWFLLLIFTFLNLFIPIKKNKLIRYIILFIILSISLLSFYHSGIELNFFNNIIACTQNSGIDVMTIEELDAIIKSAKNNDCSFPKFFVLGLTLSNLSFIFSFILFILSLIFYRKKLIINYDKKC
jgi:disulfide bond formation protein DsbB